MTENKLKLKFESGTLVLYGADEKTPVPKAFVWDARTKHFRAPAYRYREIVTEFVRSKTDYEDEAKNYSEFDFRQKFRRSKPTLARRHKFARRRL